MLARIGLLILIFIGILNQPYSYYEFLRVIVFLISIMLVIHSFRKAEKTGFEYLYIGMVVLYNPIFPIYATKDTWVIFNIFTVIPLGISLALDKDKGDRPYQKNY